MLLKTLFRTFYAYFKPSNIAEAMVVSYLVEYWIWQGSGMLHTVRLSFACDNAIPSLISLGMSAFQMGGESKLRKA
jgi:hypothetical protein